MQFGTTIAGKIDSTTCANLFGFPLAVQYSVTATQQQFFSLRLVSALRTALVPLNIASALHVLPESDTAVTSLVVVRAGTFGFLVTTQTQTPGTFTVITALNPDPRRLCVPTDVTLGVSFNTAIMSSCRSRDIRIVPALSPGQEIRISVTTPGLPVKVELRSAASGALLDDATATPGRRTASIVYKNGSRAQLVYLRVSGGSNVNDYVPVTISP